MARSARLEAFVSGSVSSFRNPAEQRHDLGGEGGRLAQEVHEAAQGVEARRIDVERGSKDTLDLGRTREPVGVEVGQLEPCAEPRLRVVGLLRERLERLGRLPPGRLGRVLIDQRTQRRRVVRNGRKDAPQRIDREDPVRWVERGDACDLDAEGQDRVSRLRALERSSQSISQEIALTILASDGDEEGDRRKSLWIGGEGTLEEIRRPRQAGRPQAEPGVLGGEHLTGRLDQQHRALTDAGGEVGQRNRGGDACLGIAERGPESRRARRSHHGAFVDPQGLAVVIERMAARAIAPRLVARIEREGEHEVEAELFRVARRVLEPRPDGGLKSCSRIPIACTQLRKRQADDGVECGAVGGSAAHDAVERLGGFAFGRCHRRERGAGPESSPGRRRRR